MKAGQVSNKQIGDGFGLDKRDKMKSCKRVGFQNYSESDVADLMV